MNKIFLYCLILLFLLGCNEKPAFSDARIVYVNDFEISQSLKGEKLDYIEHIGFMGCELMYPYLMLNLYKQANYVALYNLVERSYEGDFFTQGGGPEEFADFNILNQNNDSTFWVNDLYNRRLSEYVIKQDGDGVQMVRRNVVKYNHLSDDIYSVFVNGAHSPFYYKCFSIKEGVAIRKSSGGINIHPYNRKFTMSDMNHFTMLADCMKSDGTKMASLTGIFDQVDIVSLTSMEENLCLATTPIKSWESYENTSRDEYVYPYLSLPRCNDEYIATLHDDSGKKEFLIFDWTGNGVCRCFVDENLVDFAIDWERKVIYGVSDNEEIFVYDISFLK